MVGARIEPLLERRAAQRLERDAEPRQVRRRDEQRAAPAQHAAHLREQPDDVGDVLERLARPDDVERVLVERQRGALGDLLDLRAAGARTRARRTASAATSTAVTAAPACTSAAANAPSPQPRSSTRSPALTWPSRNARRSAKRSGSAPSGTALQTASRQSSTRRRLTRDGPLRPAQRASSTDPLRTRPGAGTPPGSS